MKTKNRNRIKAKATSLTALLVSILILSALAGVQFVGKVSALEYTQYDGTLDGADWALRIPDPWNGMLVVICQGGFTPLNPVIILTAFSSSMLNQGFAVAASNYGAVGWPVAEGVESTYQLTNYIIENYGVTGRVFLYGWSLGGGVALLLGEEYPDIYSGVLDVCGIKDVKHLYTHAATWANMTDEELTAELTALGTPVPPPGYETLQEFRDGLALMVSLYETVCGGTPETHPEAYEALSPTYHANIQIPVITIHGTADPFVPHRQSIMYKDAVAQAGKAYLYRLYNVTGAGHGDGDVMAEVPGRFDELVAWSDALTEGPYDWPMRGHDSQRSAYSDSPAPNTNQTLWSNSIGNILIGSPAIAEGSVYVGTWANRFYCLDAATGAQLWNYTTGDSVYSSPAVADGKVYVGSDDYNVYCFDAETGALIWNYTTGNEVTSSPAVVDGRVYVGSEDYNFYCLDADTGGLIWNYTTGDEIWFSSPAVADGKVYVGSNDANLYCFDAETGALTWNYTAGDIVATPSVANGRVYFGNFDDNIYCLDAATGAQLWNYTTNGDNANVAVAYGNLYVSSYDDSLYCLDAETGALVWNYTTGGDVVGLPAVADGKVYFNSIDGNVYCLNAATGAFIWSYDAGSSGMQVSSPAVANGVVYVSGGKGVVYAFSTWVPFPEGLTFGVMLLLSTVAAIVGICILQKRPKWRRR